MTGRGATSAGAGPQPHRSRTVIFALAGSFAILATWWWARSAILGDAAFGVIAGWLILPELPTVLQRLRSLLNLRRLARAHSTAGGEVKFVPTPWRRVATETLAFAALLLVCWVVLRGWFLIGGVAGCLLRAGREWDMATRHG